MAPVDECVCVWGQWQGGVGRDYGVDSRLGSRKENYSYQGKKAGKSPMQG